MIKTIYLAGRIAGVDKYWEKFEAVEEQLTAKGYTVISPTRLPQGLTNAHYMRINFATIDSVDAVVFLPEFSLSRGASLEWEYCQYIGKPTIYGEEVESLKGVKDD